MREVQYTITDPNGLHARPAGLLVKAAQKYASAIHLSCGEKKADLKRLFAVMGMGVKCGDAVTLTVDGPDEEEAARTLEEFSRANF